MKYVLEDIEVVDLGIQDIDVYDIEVDVNHNLFANDILVHNSCYLDMSLLVDKMFTKEEQKDEPERVINFLDKLFKTKVEPYIEKSYQELADYVNADEQRMFMAREVIAPSAIFCGKKRYTMQVADSEGVRYFPNLDHKIVGLDAIRASYPKFCRDWMKEAYNIALSGTEEELHAFVKEKKKEFFELPVEKISTPKGISDINKFLDLNGPGLYIKGATKQAKASIWHNHLIDKLGLTGIPKINGGDKIMMIELKTPNPYQCECIGYKGKFPTEFGLGKYVDYEANWRQSFLAPMENILTTIGWNHTQQVSLMDWFD